MAKLAVEGQAEEGRAGRSCGRSDLAASRTRRDDDRRSPRTGTGILKNLFLDSAKNRLGEHPAPARSARRRPAAARRARGDVPLRLGDQPRRLARAWPTRSRKSIDDASFTGLFDSIAAILGQQFVLLPYYFAVFHQNKERHLLREITGNPPPRTPQTLRVGLFTDTLDDVNGVARFLRDMGEQAAAPRPALRRSTRARPTPQLRGARTARTSPRCCRGRCRTTRS